MPTLLSNETLMIHPKRMHARMEGKFVVLLIGMRINHWWAVHRWMPVAMAMGRMIKELEANPDSGFLGMEQGGFSNPFLMVQYWRSYEQLEKYARSHDSEHWPAWVDFNKRMMKTGSCGVWHETYRISEGSYENIYSQMPPFGLGRVGELLEVGKGSESARERMKGS